MLKGRQTKFGLESSRYLFAKGILLAAVLIVGLGGDNTTDQMSFVELSGRPTSCPKMSKYPVKVINAAGVLFDQKPLVCGGIIARSVG